MGIQLRPRFAAKNQPRVDLQADVFRKLAHNKGLIYLWEQAAACPCSQNTAAVASGFGLTANATKRTGRARADCPVCGGKGWLWHTPTQGVGMFTASQDNPIIQSLGEGGRGSALLTCPPEAVPAWKDRITLLDSHMIKRELRVRGADVQERLRYPIEVVTLALEEGDTDVGVLYLRRAGLDGRTADEDELTPGVDFLVTDDGKIDWTPGIESGRAPVQGAPYTVSYYHRPRYLVDNFPHTWRTTRTVRKQPDSIVEPLPVQVLLMLEHKGEEGFDG
uniref:Uncharacterized protein n=1 Tax=uncultured Caudovirales phage TaxID=2100421 RepID=A0A6J5L5M6_9CAUD|nr:hypothetical protein UFOVP114_54 [uncultured Caudovirales phage]